MSNDCHEASLSCRHGIIDSFLHHDEYSQRLIGDYWTKTHTCPHPVHCNSLLCRSRSSKKVIKHAGWACTIEVNSCNDLNELLYVLGISMIFRVFNHAYIHAEEIMDQIDPLALDYYQMWVVPLMGW
jgi:hypothetical protein